MKSLLELTDNQVLHLGSIFFSYKQLCQTDHSEIVYKNGQPIMNLYRKEGRSIRVRDFKDKTLMWIYHGYFKVITDAQYSSDWKEAFRYLQQQGFDV